ncbi:hypothetical protein CHUUTOTORO_01510 [Serratia phage vB_SmaM-ChuuTotoro]|nr:hypothetical protein CHUUTOTORO_01510 [Serratia phage vB_SmaM-ChuuTotoro]
MAKYVIRHIPTDEYYLAPMKGTTPHIDKAHRYNNAYIQKEFFIRYLLKIGRIEVIEDPNQ